MEKRGGVERWRRREMGKKGEEERKWRREGK